MFKMQILTQADKKNLWKNVLNHKKHILRKLGLKFSKPYINPTFYAKYHYVLL